MYCLKCGREIPDNELFCDRCSRNEPYIREAPDNPDKSPAAIVAEKAATVKKPPKPKNPYVWRFWLVSVLLLAALCYLAYNYADFARTKASFRVREANLALKEEEAAGVIAERDSLQAQLEADLDAIAERDSRITDLENQLYEKESSSAQAEYNMANAQSTIATLTEEKEALRKERDETVTKYEELLTLAEAQKEQTDRLRGEYDSLQSEYKTLKSGYDEAKGKADFMDSYVVFVNNSSGTGYYHRYDCSHFTKSNFWAYSRKLAENNGYQACPYCCK